MPKLQAATSENKGCFTRLSYSAKYTKGKLLVIHCLPILLCLFRKKRHSAVRGYAFFLPYWGCRCPLWCLVLASVVTTHINHRVYVMVTTMTPMCLSSCLCYSYHHVIDVVIHFFANADVDTHLFMLSYHHRNCVVYRAAYGKQLHHNNL